MPDFVENSDPTARFSGLVENQFVDIVPTAFMGVAGVVLLILVLGTVGLVLGLMSCKSKVQERGKMGKVSHMILMFTVFLAFVFMPFYMIPGSILFAVGAPFNMFCAPLQDLSIFTEVTKNL